MEENSGKRNGHGLKAFYSQEAPPPNRIQPGRGQEWGWGWEGQFWAELPPCHLQASWSRKDFIGAARRLC